MNQANALYKSLTLPVICTRGIIYFPHNEMPIDAGRPKSLNAINEARNNCDDFIIILPKQVYR